MVAQVPLFPEQASTHAKRVDDLFFFILAVTGAVAVLVILLMIYFVVRYRRRPEVQPTPRILDLRWLETVWTVVPFFIFMIMFAWGAQIYFGLAQPPADALEVYVVGKQWMWKNQHLEGYREINELHVPVGQPIKLILTSEDVIHDFAVPAFRTKIDVLPGRYVRTWFQATKTGRFRLYCNQFCGTNHAGMTGYIVVMEPAEYATWLSSHAEGSLALEGRKLFLKLQCISCHSADSRARAPVLENLFDRTVHLRDGNTVIADEKYIRESILTPQAKVVAGWEPIMPTFQGQVDEADLIKLIVYIKSLRPGQTPVRTEDAVPPVRGTVSK